MATNFTPARAKAILDLAYPTSGGVSYIAWSANGTSETSSLARTAVGATGWAAATTATPAVKANANQLTSANATAAVTVSHFALVPASTGGTLETAWIALPTAQTLAVGDNLKIAAGDLKITI